jgi:hypothetical protein
MKKLRAFKSAIVAPVLMLSTLAPAMLSGTPVLAAGGTLTWCGTGAVNNPAGQPLTNVQSSLDASLTTNWITSGTDCSSNNPTGTGWANAATLFFDTGASAETIINQVDNTSGTLLGIEVKAGGITLSGNTSGSPLPMGGGTGAFLTVDTPSVSTNFLNPGYVSVVGPVGTGILTIDGFNPATSTLPLSNSAVAGPVTLTVSDSGVASPYVYTASSLESLFGAAVGGQVDLGNNAELDLAGNGTDFTDETLWTIEVDTGGVLRLTGSVPSSGNAQKGTTYAEAGFIGNGGTFAVDNNAGAADVATLATLSLNANSFADVVEAADALKATSFTANGFSFSYPPASGDLGAFPKAPSTGTGQGGGGGTPTVPKAPDTGFGLVSAKVLPVLATTLAAAAILLFAARRIKPATKR